jgi:hypothetical protein
MTRQFCSMAREFGFSNATDFALVVESWTQEQRRNCLQVFYKQRETRVQEMEAVTGEEDVAGAKSEHGREGRTGMAGEGGYVKMEGIERGEVGHGGTRHEADGVKTEAEGGPGGSYKTPIFLSDDDDEL